MIDDALADDIVRSFEREPTRWKVAEADAYVSWYARDDGLRVAVGFTSRKYAVVHRGEYTASLTHKRSIDRLWKAIAAWREWLRVTTLQTIANSLEDKAP